MWSHLKRFIGIEWALFTALPRNARILLGTSTLFVFGTPVVSIFISAYIMRNSHDLVKVMSYQLALYTGVPVMFYLNGLFLRWVKSSVLYASGLVLTGLSIFAMTSMTVLTLTGIVLCGLLMGVAIGLHWANRNLLSLAHTQDRFRNYYFGIESFFYCVSGVLMPAAIGLFIVWYGNGHEADAGANRAYRVIAAGVVALALCASGIVLRGTFGKTSVPAGGRVRYDKAWRGLLLLAALKGITQVFQSCLPAMLVMRLLGGRENALGMIQSTAALAAALLMYLIGRNTKPGHRLGLLSAALLLYAAGAVVNASFFNPWSMLFFIGALSISQPLTEWAMAAIQMQVIDGAVAREKGNGYTYLCGYEWALYGGRMLGGGAFVLVASGFSGDTALRYVLAAVALVQLLAIPLTRAVMRFLREQHFGFEDEHGAVYSEHVDV